MSRNPSFAVDDFNDLHPQANGGLIELLKALGDPIDIGE